jgi:D-alanyl-D-alanine carboxypeptidase/D-alanyl-D-alanine-endopeptidase (penicillin-binding protein 4)
MKKLNIMKKIRQIKKLNFLLFCSALITSFSVSAKPSDLPGLIEKSKFKGPGLIVVAGHDPRSLFASHNADKKLIPASVTKLVTAAAALHHFPPGTKFKTGLWSDAKIENGVLKGNLYLKGGGDPSFVSENLWYLVNIFTRTQITKIEGQILVDDSLFDRVRFDPSRQDIRVDRAYDAPTGGMSFNWNSVNIFVRPAAKVGQPALVFADPLNSYIRVVSSVTTGPKGGAHSVVVDRDTDPKGDGDLIKVSGKIPFENKEIVIYKNITQPDIWAGHNLKAFLAQRGIQVTGGVAAAGTPGAAKLLAEAEGKEIQDIVTDMNKFSNNYVAEMLTKAIGAIYETPGSIPKGMTYLNSYMKSLGIEEKEFFLINPSGLTRENLLSGQSLWKLLVAMQDQFRVQPEFLESLPIAGVDGTLKNRMKGTAAEGMVRAKTGFLTGVVSLAGYAGRKDGNAIPFVFIYNGSADESEVRAFFDKMAIALVE